MGSCLDRNDYKSLPQEWADYLLIKELYHCTPEELDRQEYAITEMHIGFLGLQNRSQNIEGKRASQRAKFKKK